MQVIHSKNMQAINSIFLLFIDYNSKNKTYKTNCKEKQIAD